jgi:hypothetical protein
MKVEVIVPTGAETCSVLYNHFFRPRHEDGVRQFQDLVRAADRRTDPASLTEPRRRAVVGSPRPRA